MAIRHAETIHTKGRLATVNIEALEATILVSILVVSTHSIIAGESDYFACIETQNTGYRSIRTGRTTNKANSSVNKSSATSGIKYGTQTSNATNRQVANKTRETTTIVTAIAKHKGEVS